MNITTLRATVASTLAVAAFYGAPLQASETAPKQHIMIDGATYEVDANRPIVIRADGTPGYADVDAPKQVSVAKPEPATPPAATPTVSAEPAPVILPAAPIAAPESKLAPTVVPVEASPPAALPAQTIQTHVIVPVPPLPPIPGSAPVEQRIDAKPVLQTVEAAPAAPITVPTSVPAKTDGGWARNLDIPFPDIDGSFETPNRRLSPAALVWHVRTAMNVATLQCNEGDHATKMLAGYTALLAVHRDALADAETRLAAEYGADAPEGRERYDESMTRLYNFWALPPVKDAFCDEAVEAIARLAAAEATNDTLATRSRTILSRLEAPFTTFFGEYDAWRTAGYPARTAIRTAASVAAPLVKPGPIGAPALP